MNNTPNGTSTSPTRNTLIGYLALAWIVLLIFTGYVVSAFIHHFQSDDTAPSTSSDTVQQQRIPVHPEEPKPTYRRISARDLCAYYNSNGVAADALFKDQIIEVTGVVKQIESMFGVPFVYLDTRDPICDIQCYFAPGSEAQLLSLQKGQRVTIRGVCEGKAVFNVVLGDCSVQNP
jgi:hypothetical protein